MNNLNFKAEIEKLAQQMNLALGLCNEYAEQKTLCDEYWSRIPPVVVNEKGRRYRLEADKNSSDPLRIPVFFMEESLESEIKEFELANKEYHHRLGMVINLNNQIQDLNGQIQNNILNLPVFEFIHGRNIRRIKDMPDFECFIEQLSTAISDSGGTNLVRYSQSDENSLSIEFLGRKDKLFFLIELKRDEKSGWLLKQLSIVQKP